MDKLGRSLALPGDLLGRGRALPGSRKRPWVERRPGVAQFSRRAKQVQRQAALVVGPRAEALQHAAEPVPARQQPVAPLHRLFQQADAERGVLAQLSTNLLSGNDAVFLPAIARVFGEPLSAGAFQSSAAFGADLFQGDLFGEEQVVGV